MMHSYFEPGERLWRAWLPDGRSFEVSYGRWFGPRFELSETHLAIAFPGLSLHLPYPGSKEFDDVDVNNNWRCGFYCCDDHFSAQWGRINSWLPIKDQPKRSVLWRWPWRDWVHVRHEVLSEPESHSFAYKLKSGETQNRTATIQHEEREWRLMFKWSPIKNRYRGIDVIFDDEVGERTGSWKGGTIGCGYESKPGETPLETLRRMEQERVFR